MHGDPAGRQFFHDRLDRDDPRLAEELLAQGAIRGMDRDVEGGEPLFPDPGQLLPADIGQGDVIAVEKGEAVILVLDVEGGAEPAGELVDKAEDASVAALQRDPGPGRSGRAAHPRPRSISTSQTSPSPLTISRVSSSSALKKL